MRPVAGLVVAIVVAGATAAALGARSASDRHRVTARCCAARRRGTAPRHPGAASRCAADPSSPGGRHCGAASTARARPWRSALPSIARLRRLTPEGTPHPLPILGRAVDARRPAVAPRLAARPAQRHARMGPAAQRRRVRARTPPARRRSRRAEAHAAAPRSCRLLRPSGRRAGALADAAGRFIVRNRLYGYDSPMYGPVAFGTSARSPTLTDWPAGGFVGIHGTDRPELLPGRVSHGCIRLRNADIRRLARLLPVGTPVTIR